MPELPEVETIARKLQLVLPGKTLVEVKILHDKSWQGNSQLVLKKKVNQVSRRARLIRIHLDNNLNLLVHLKMTGQLLFREGNYKVGGGHPTKDWLGDLPSKHTRVVLNLVSDTGDAELFFNDQRIFGWIKLLTDEEVVKLYSKFGPDAHKDDFSADYLFPLLERKRIPIKMALMDNSLVAGVGNIYASESLNLARLSPLRPSQSLTITEVNSLVSSTKTIIKRAMELGGTTFDGKYVDAEGLAGKYQTVVRVYGREGYNCPNCNSIIVKTTLGGRGTYFCPNCQV